LPPLAQRDFVAAQYDKEWYKRSTDLVRVTLLNNYVKLKGMTLWHHVAKRNAKTDAAPGLLLFLASDILTLRRVLDRRPDFSWVDSSLDKWTSRESRFKGSLHFKHFANYGVSGMQCHIDQLGLCLRNPILRIPGYIVTGPAHWHDWRTDSYKDVFEIRELLLEQGWDREVLLGVGAKADGRK
jgi:hypothetical protein